MEEQHTVLAQPKFLCICRVWAVPYTAHTTCFILLCTSVDSNIDCTVIAGASVMLSLGSTCSRIVQDACQLPPQALLLHST